MQPGNCSHLVQKLGALQCRCNGFGHRVARESFRRGLCTGGDWPTKKLEELVLAGKLAHAGHPVLRWMAGNVSIEQDAADNWKPTKKRSPERIDGIVALIVALIMALDRTTRAEEPSGGLILL